MAKRILSMTLALTASPLKVAIASVQDQIFHRVLAVGTTYCRNLQTTARNYGLQEFFDDPSTYGEAVVKSGRAWRIDELRNKSNSDLHKLWFVLYKERNMLYTMKEAARHDCEIFPSPERIDKVETSMKNLEEVVMERNKAYWQLEVSPCVKGTRPTYYRRDVLGRYKWAACSQHLVPYHKNWAFRNLNRPSGHNEVDWFFRRYREMKRKEYNNFRSKLSQRIRHIIRRFPDCDAEYMEEVYPHFPPGYIKHLKENIDLYQDRPPKGMSTR